jgi:hypothetical protein
MLNKNRFSAGFFLFLQILTEASITTAAKIENNKIGLKIN